MLPWSSVNNCTHSIQHNSEPDYGYIRSELEKIRGNCWEFGNDTLSALLKGSAINIGEGRLVRIRGGGFDEFGSERPIHIIEEYTPAVKSGVFKFKGRLKDIVRD